jgi:sugar phosphate isomerase/epimerase
MPRLSLDCLTLTDTSPSDLIRSASTAGFDLVSISVNPPAAYPRQIVTRAVEVECAALFAGTGVDVHSLEVFDLVSEERIRACRPALELGARLGGKVAVAIHAANPDRAHVVDLLAALVELAGEYGLGVNLEPIAMGLTRTLAEARDLIRDAGVDAGILFDTYHLMRTGGSVDHLRAIEPGLIRYVQINDGPLYVSPENMYAEAVGERLYPGEGVFPLTELLRAAPVDIPWAIETPSLRRAQRGVSPQMQAKEAMAAMRRLLDAASCSSA